MMRLAVFLIGCIALSTAQLQFLPWQTAPGWPTIPMAPAAVAPATPVVQPIHHRNPAAEHQLAHTIVAHEHNDRVLQQQQLQQLAAITGVAPGAPAAPVAPAVPGFSQFMYPGFPALLAG